MTCYVVWVYCWICARLDLLWTVMVSRWQNGLLSISVADGVKTYDWSVLHTNCNLISFYSINIKKNNSLQNQAVVNLRSADVPLCGYRCKDLISVLGRFTRLAMVISLESGRQWGGTSCSRKPRKHLLRQACQVKLCHTVETASVYFENKGFSMLQMKSFLEWFLTAYRQSHILPPTIFPFVHCVSVTL